MAPDNKLPTGESAAQAALHERFLEWARDNYSGFEYEEVMNHYVQSGDYPNDFVEQDVATMGLPVAESDELHEKKLATLIAVGFSVRETSKQLGLFEWVHKENGRETGFFNSFDRALDDAWTVAGAEAIYRGEAANTAAACRMTGDARDALWAGMTFPQQREIILVEHLMRQDGVAIKDKINELDPKANCDYQEDGVWRVHGTQCDERDVRLYLLGRHLFAEKLATNKSRMR